MEKDFIQYTSDHLEKQSNCAQTGHLAKESNAKEKGLILLSNKLKVQLAS